jgi:cytochrome P450
LAEKYGPLMHLKLGEVSYVIVSSPEMAKEIMKTHAITFCDRPNVLLPRVFTYNARDIAFSTYGELWRQLRKICVVELLSAKRVQSFSFIREEEVSDIVKLIFANEGSIVNLSMLIFSMTYGIVARSAFGKKNRHQQAFKSTIEEALGLLGEFCIADFYPSIKILQKVSRVKTRIEKLQGEIDRILQDIVNDHRNDSKTIKDEDLVDVLLKVQHENVHSQQPLTDENIKSVIQVSLFPNMLICFPF